MRGAGIRGKNALDRELVVRVEEAAHVPAEAVYALLADLRSHLQWAGERQEPHTRLLSIDAPHGPAGVGTEFQTTGADPMGTFDDRSVVTEATAGRAFEFVTEARLVTKKGKRIDWTNVHRYEMEPTADGCRIVYTMRIARLSELTGMLVLLKVPGLRVLTAKASAKVARRAVRNLSRLAEETDGEGR
jgi:Polyketide cyclase / dehydrase and lipid transport